MEKLFFSKDNFRIIYGILQKKINDTLSYDINNSQEFNKELVNIMKTVYQQRGTFNTPANISNIDMSRFLSQKVINVANHYFNDSIKKNNKMVKQNIPEIDNMKRELQQAGNRINQLSDRPQASNLISQSDVNSSYESIIKERLNNDYTKPTPTNISFSEKINPDVSNRDVAKRFEEISNNRQQEYETVNSTSNMNTQPSLTNQFSENISGNQQGGLSSQFNTISGQLPNNFSNNMPNELTTQQNFINDPSQNEMQLLIEEQQKLQSRINDFQKNIATSNSQNMTNVQHQNSNTVSELSNQFNMPSQTREPAFIAPPQANTQFYSESEPSKNLFANQFNSVTNEFTEENKPNMPTNYTEILNQMNNNETPNQQFETQMQNLSESNNENTDGIFPSKAYDTSFPLENKVTVRSIENSNSQIDVIKKHINDQSKTIDAQNAKLEKLISLYEKNDITKFYDTIMDIPKIIKDQTKQPLTIRTHNLIVSSRDRDLSKTDFNKYNFKIVFGAEGNTTRSIMQETGKSTGKLQNTEETFISSGLNNPTVQQVLKNVISIKLKRVIIPKPRLDNYYPEPYYFVCVDEFKSNIISTKTFNENIFCKIHFDKELSFGNDNRTYMYYKNDDDDYTMFYPSPLGKLDRLTLKLLSSDGKSAAESFNDRDIITNTEIAASKSTIPLSNNTTESYKFYSGTFQKDAILAKDINTHSETDSRITDIEGIDTNTATLTVSNIINSTTNIVNLTNQLEYIFEIKTQEPDPTSELRPNI
tara:strand:- start:6685 stop:8970 length:2286 start_codon:yes stop_codon:yes gene_type:complete